jgi:alpha-mannosidase
VQVRSVASDQIARDIMSLPAASLERLPRYKGELLMTDHGTGCYTSQAAMKRYNRKNERLADAAERASVVAQWLGSSPYPREVLRDNWIRFLWHQFHDDLTGTSIPEAYVYSWNDEAIALNQFGSILNDAVGGVSRALDTRATGVPIVVYNALGIDREDVVEADVTFDGAAPRAARVWGPQGQEVPSQTRANGTGLHVTFLAVVPAAGFAVYDVRPSDTPCDIQTGLSASEATLENARYRLRIDANGDIASVLDKRANRELLASPIRLQMIADQPYDWAAWEIDYDDIMAPPRTLVASPAITRIVDRGPACCAIEIVRSADGSTFRQTVRLAAGGAADRIEVSNDVDWGSKGTLLKAAFPLAMANEKATYDLGLGTIERGINRKVLYEVPAQQWADLTASDGGYGVAVMNDCKYGWDKPDDHTLRLTLVRTPEVNERWSWIKDQRSMDLGRHRFTFAICGHAGDWRDGNIPLEADRLNQPLLAYQVPSHPGGLGRSFSFIHLSHPSIAVRAIKMAEDSDEIIVRLQELHGKEARAVRFDFARPIVNGREVNGVEEGVGPALINNGGISCSFAPYQPRTFAVRLDGPPIHLDPTDARTIALPFNMEGATLHGVPAATPFDGAGNTLPGELLPARLACGAIPFDLGAPGRQNVLACRGQRIAIPAGAYDRVCLIAAAVGGDRKATFSIDDHRTDLWIQDYAEPIGQWDSRLATGRFLEERSEILPAYLKTDPIAWVGTHRHTKDGKAEAYAFAQMYRYTLPIAQGAQMLTLPDDDRIRVLAITAAEDPNAAARPMQPLFDLPERTGVRVVPESPDFLESTHVSMSSPNEGAIIRYTLDGADPTADSPTYKEPIRISKPTTVKARAFLEGMDTSFIARVTLNKLTPRAATSVPGAIQGLTCRYYEESWSKVPDFRTLTPVRTMTVDRVAAPAFARQENYGLFLTGYLKVPRDGLYMLHLWSDDGSTLRLGDAPLIDNDGLHGRGEVPASFALKAGFHPLEISFFQKMGDQAFELWIEGPDLPLQQVPPEMLAHAGTDR